ncbi:hypothetical protein P879_11114 [Paragonimus westermani]|uniref:GOLD domain-containing protein n=1 Tax=Paragonimus westermani TaxID=34504 RepID=A0A8T0DK94_9TREM|nr:hypothetical protein P879_11114 [Paragonimus westermani]
MRKIIEHRQRSSYETVQFNSTVDGDYKLCFSNVFSSVTHKVVFFAWYNEVEVDFAYAEKSGPDTLKLSEWEVKLGLVLFHLLAIGLWRYILVRMNVGKHCPDKTSCAQVTTSKRCLENIIVVLRVQEWTLAISEPQNYIIPVT